MDVRRGVNMKEIGHHYDTERDCNGSVMASGIRTGATIMMMIFLSILVILGIFGFNINITFYRPSTFTFNDHGGFRGNSDPLSFSTLLDHERNSTVSAEENAILRDMFDEYDADGDGLWSYGDFSGFYADKLHFDETFELLDSHTNDGYIDYDELVLLFTVLDTAPKLHTEEIHELLVEVTGLPLEEALEKEPEVLATLVYENIGHGEDGISEDEWFDYMCSMEWDELNDDKDSVVDFAEFERDFFESQLFLTYQECSHEGACANPDAIQTFEDSQLVHYTPLSLSTRRRLVWVVWIAVVVVIIFVVVVVTMNIVEIINDFTNCYDGQSLITVMGDESVPQMVAASDVNVGDYVYDGNEFTKVSLPALSLSVTLQESRNRPIDLSFPVTLQSALIVQVYFKQRYHENYYVKMLEIKYGVPSDEHSVTITPAHLLYREAAPFPVRSDEIRIGDVLWGSTEYSYGDGFNFTVYDISTVRKVPVHPFTMSSDMMVNGVKTSVYTHSVENRNALHDAAAIFRWTSSNIDETMAHNLFDFYYYSVYRGMMMEEMQRLTTDNGAVLGALYMVVPLMVGLAVYKAVSLLVPSRSSRK